MTTLPVPTHSPVIDTELELDAGKPDTRLTVEEAAKSLTGFDEVAIEQYFRKDVSDLTATMSMRAVVFVLQRRAGLGDPDAYRFAMTLGLGEVEGQFRPAHDPAAGGEVPHDVDGALAAVSRPEA